MTARGGGGQYTCKGKKPGIVMRFKYMYLGAVVQLFHIMAHNLKFSQGLHKPL